MNGVIAKHVFMASIPVSIFGTAFYIKRIGDQQCLRRVEEMLSADKVPPTRIKEYLELYK